MKRFYNFTAKAKPTWHNIRWVVSNMFIWFARKAKPDNPEIFAYIAEKTIEAYMEALIMGESVTCPQCMQQIKSARGKQR